MEKYPTNEVNMDERKTPAKRIRHVAFNSLSIEKQPDQSDKLDKIFNNLTEKCFTLLVEKQSPPCKKSANEDERNKESFGSSDWESWNKNSGVAAFPFHKETPKRSTILGPNIQSLRFH